MLKHADIWRAIDRLAALHQFSPSGLARRAGLSPTLFNPSKRFCGKRPRWPSTESIAAILKATETSLDDFVALARQDSPARQVLPLLSLAEAQTGVFFDEAGLPTTAIADSMALPGATDGHAFVIEVRGTEMEPLYHDGDLLIASPATPPRRGDRVIVRLVSGEILIRRLEREGAQKIELAALRADEPPLAFSRAVLAWMHRIVWASQ